MELTKKVAKITTTLKKNMFSSKSLLFLFIFGVILFGCQKRSQQDNKEIFDKTEKFLRHALITHCGVYTLIGAKPITEFRNLTEEPSQERLLQIYENLSQKVRAEHSFEEISYHFKEEYELWDDWIKVKDKFIGENFRFFTDPFRKDHIIFANLAAVALVLDEHYEDFRTTYGQDFDPTQIVYSIDSKDSDFWKACFSDHYLTGLLYGFGKSNAKLFDWERNKKRPGKAKTGSCNLAPEVNNPPITELLIPSFAIYSPLDPKFLFYRQMREEIIRLYDGKDFKELTLKLLKDNENSFTGLIDKNYHFSH